MDLQIVKVPYRDIMQAPNDLAEERIQVLSTSLAVVQPLMKAGKIKVLAVTSKQRAPTAPDIPTATEVGYPDADIREHRRRIRASGDVGQRA